MLFRSTGNVLPFQQTPVFGVISDSDRILFYLVNNASGTVIITLPHANIAGREIWIIAMCYTGAGTCSNAANDSDPGNAVTVQRQGTDTISDSAGSVTSYTAARSVRLISDGNGHWIRFSFR